MDSLISVRGDGCGPYYQGSSACAPPVSELPYGLPNCGYFPGLGKRTEPSAQSMVPASSPYMPVTEPWLDAPRSCRVNQPAASQQGAPCFSPNIKEESAYCVYEQKCSKPSAAEDLSYTRLAPAACSLTDSANVPMPGYFRLSQTHAHPKAYRSAQSNPPHFDLQTPVRFDTPPSSSSTSAGTARKESEEAPRREAEGEPSSPEAADAQKGSPGAGDKGEHTAVVKVRCE